MPAAVFTDPQIASIGLREQDCRDRGIPYVTKIQNYGDVAFGWAMEDTTGVVKLVASRTAPCSAPTSWARRRPRSSSR